MSAVDRRALVDAISRLEDNADTIHHLEAQALAFRQRALTAEATVERLRDVLRLAFHNADYGLTEEARQFGRCYAGMMSAALEPQDAPLAPADASQVPQGGPWTEVADR